LPGGKTTKVVFGGFPRGGKVMGFPKKPWETLKKGKNWPRGKGQPTKGMGTLPGLKNFEPPNHRGKLPTPRPGTNPLKGIGQGI